LFGSWLNGLRPNPTFSDPLRLLVIYDVIPLCFGLMAIIQLGAVQLDEKRRAFFNALIIWAIVAFALFTFGSDKAPSGVVIVIIPLVLLAGWYIGTWLERAAEETDRNFFIAQELPVSIFALVIGAFLFLVVAEYVTRGSLATTAVIARIIGLSRPVDTTFDLEIVLISIVVAFAAVGFLIVATVGWRRAPTIVMGLVLTVFAIWTFRQNAMMNYGDEYSPREYLVASAASASVRDLKADLRDVSRWRAADSTTATIAVDDSLSPIVAWTLRDFRNAHFIARASVAQDVQIVLVPAGTPAPASGWMGQTYTLESMRAEGASLGWMRWLIFRDVGTVQKQSVTLWIRQPG
jgi:hypothetical protein